MMPGIDHYEVTSGVLCLYDPTSDLFALELNKLNKKLNN